MSKLFIGGLPGGLNKGFVHKELSKFGHIVDLWIARNPPGFAFVQLDSYSDMEKAMDALNGSTIFGPKIKVEFARSVNCKASPVNRHRSRNNRSPPSNRYGSSSLPHRSGLSTPPSSDYYARPCDHVSLRAPEIFSAPSFSASASLPFHPAAYPEATPILSPPYLGVSNRDMYGSRREPLRRSPGYHRRSRSPVGRGRRSSYDRYRDGRRDNGDSSYRRDRRRVSPLPPPLFRREKSPPLHYRRGRPSSASYRQHPYPTFPLSPVGGEMGLGDRFHYVHRSHLSHDTPDRRGRRY
nr:splicing factor arginine serine rich,arginine serine rich splicing factor [Hymenolepis microstoma]